MLESGKQSRNHGALTVFSHDEGVQLTLRGGADQPDLNLAVAPEGGRLQVMQRDGELGAQLSARAEGGALDLFNSKGERESSLP